MGALYFMGGALVSVVLMASVSAGAYKKGREDGINEGYQIGYERAIDECIKMIEETAWRDTDMLVENISEKRR